MKLHKLCLLAMLFLVITSCTDVMEEDTFGPVNSPNVDVETDLNTEEQDPDELKD